MHLPTIKLNQRNQMTDTNKTDNASDGGLHPMTCSPLADFEKGPWSYDLYADGLEPVALLNNPDHSQGEWVDIKDYRKLELELADERKLANGLANGLLHEAGTGDVLPLSRAYEAWKAARTQSQENAQADTRRP